MENNWLTPKLKQEVRKVFEPRYNRKLTDKEVFEIADNLSEVVEIIVKYQWRKKYEKTFSRSKKNVTSTDDQRDNETDSEKQTA